MEDKDIIKALDILCKIDFFGQRAGRELWNEKPADIQNQDIENHSKDIAFLKDFFNRQQAEIEDLKVQFNLLDVEFGRIEKAEQKHYDDIFKAKVEAVKEFAERVNKEAEKVAIDQEGDFVTSNDKIYDTVADWCKATSDNLVKEIGGKQNG